MKNILTFMILVSLISCYKDDAPAGPGSINKRSMVTITVSYPKTCENSLNWGKITISVAAKEADLVPGSTIASSSFITNADPGKEPLVSLLNYGRYIYKVSLLSYCNSHPNFEEVGSFEIQSSVTTINVTIK